MSTLLSVGLVVWSSSIIIDAGINFESVASSYLGVEGSLALIF